MVGQFAGVPYDAKGISIIKFRRRTAQVYYQRDYYSEGDIMANIPGLDEAIVGLPHLLPVRRGSDLRLPAGGPAERRPVGIEPTETGRSRTDRTTGCVPGAAAPRADGDRA